VGTGAVTSSGGGTGISGGSSSGGASNGGSSSGGTSSGGASSGGSSNGGAGNGSGGSAGNGGATSSGGTSSGGSGGASGDCSTPPAPSPLAGWASVSGNGVSTTTGGDGGSTTTVTSLSDLTAAVKGTDPKIIQIEGDIEGDVTIGSNKTLIGLCGAKIHGYVSLNKSVNVIIRNLTIVGKNCSDSTNDCSGGDDAITVQGAAHHLWFDHDDVSDGSDGNLDMTHASDFITISWTKFHYSGRRTDPAGASGGHQFSNLIGHSDDNASEDTGHLRITFHHSWWADNVVERMPRARFGQVHLFDNLYTATGNDYCIGVGNGVSIRADNNVFIGVADPIKSYSTDGTGVIESNGNVYTNTTGSSADVGSGTVFTPPYTATIDPTSGLEAAIRAGAGPK
jgi:pectate lyase